MAEQVAIGGLRVSTEQQSERYGPDRQRRDIEREAGRAGLTLVEWVEESVSGADHDRAAENRYFELVDAHPGLNVVFSAANRVGRHIEVTVGIAREIHRRGGTVWVADLGNLRERRNWKNFLRDAVDAENEYTTLVQQMQDGKRDKARKGLWPHGAPRWGYRLARDESGQSILPEPHPDRAPAILRAVELLELGWGDGRVAVTMRAEGWPAPTTRGWTERTVASLTRDARYTGVAEFQGHLLKYPAIIEPERLRHLQRSRANRRLGHGPRGDNPWSGILRCALCDGALSVSRHGANRIAYYRCWRSHIGVVNRCPNKRFYPSRVIEPESWAAIVADLTNPERLTQSLVLPEEQPVAEKQGQTRAELEAAIARAWEPHTRGVPRYTYEMAEAAAAPYVAALDALDITPDVPVAPDVAAMATQFAALLQDGILTPTDQAEVLRDLPVYVIWGLHGYERVDVRL